MLLSKKLKNKDLKAKKFEEKDIYKYELFYLIEFNLYDDSSYLIASTIVEKFSINHFWKIYINFRDRKDY